MLTIRDEQLAVLERLRRAQFEAALLRRVAREYPDDYASMGEAGARKFVGDAIGFAVARNICGEGAISVLLELLVEFGPGLALAPCRTWALQILEHPRLAGHIKVSLVRDRLSSLTGGRRIVRRQQAMAASA